MYIQEIFYIFVTGLILGLVLTVFWDFLETRVLLRKIKTEADHILQEAQEKVGDFLEKHKKECQLVNEKKLNVFEKEKEILTSSFQSLQSKIDKKMYQSKIRGKEKSFQLEKWKKITQEFHQRRKNILEEKEKLSLKIKQYIQDKVENLEREFSINLDELKEGLKKEITQSWTNQVRENIEKNQDRQNLQKDSFFYLNMVLNRFDRVYCPERGIAPIFFKNLQHLESTVGENNIYLNEIEKGCGVDIVVNKEDLQASVFGIDPVRRELGRLSLKKIANKNRINLSFVKKIIKISKKDLFSKIRSDGLQICKRLRLTNVAPEVQNMMGALRYRYSFAQNQYFHCEEVGWLCGLLNAELSLSVKPAQRSGMFHDIGKAMDHSIEGNHAVIGAEFLSKYNECQEVLHAVRAHHHDETPSTPLAYLVIVADSISGSRPGARRFTEDSYNRKMANLERIIDSFENIEDAYIMSAGREMRVIVDNKKVSDVEAVDLSKLIARKIERECSYPGLIKVTVVRHSEKVATV